MKKTLLASAIAMSLGTAVSVDAATITITNMNFGPAYGATGSMNDSASGSMSSTDVFNSFHWTANQQNWFDTHTGTLSWSDADQSNYVVGSGTFNYSFSLTGNQVAAGTWFNWNTNYNIPVLTIYDCATGGPGGACTGNSLAMAAGPFAGSSPQFTGSTGADFAVSGTVPVPAAAWLMGSGLLGLVGVARRRRKV